MAIKFGLQRFFHDIRYHRERFRQFIGIYFVILVSVIGKPKGFLFYTGVCLIVLGIATRLWASGHIKKDKVLATNGPYAFVRHPLYVGNLVLGFGFALASGLWWSLPAFIVIVVLFYPHAIRQEDKKLHQRFKKDWEQWSRETRALIPRLRPSQPLRNGIWSFMQSLRQNGEPVIALFLLFMSYILSFGLY